MEALSEFYLNYETILFYPHYDDYGKLQTMAIGNQASVLVDMAPSELIDFNLSYYGSSLVGARAGAKAVLGKVNRPPVVVNKTFGIYWFPINSPSKEDCVWIALHHVKDYSSLEKGKTTVVFTNGRSITLDISHYSFSKRMQRAYELKGKIENRTKALENLTFEQQQLSFVNEETSKYIFKVNPRNRSKHMEFSMDMVELNFEGIKQRS